ncbi:MAG: carboxymuconolactone decarboxylase family protein [Candidatus Saccharimonadales bacterium]
MVNKVKASPTTLAAAASPMTLAAALQNATIDPAILEQRHGPLLRIGQQVLGVKPNSNAFLEIWPTGFRSYNLMVPSFLNIPALLLPTYHLKQTVGLAMYAASRASGCAYCSAHTCSFAIRRGTAAEKVAMATQSILTEEVYNETELAVIAVAESLGRVPTTLTPDERDALKAVYNPAEVEWIILSVALMGFLNKFMDAVSVPLEIRMIVPAEQVIAPSGWRAGKHMPTNTTDETKPDKSWLPPIDDLGTILGLIPHLPAVIWRNKQWTKGVPNRWPKVGDYLKEHTGHDWPILSKLQHHRPVQAVATILRDNTDPATSEIGLRLKHLVGLVYATVAEDAELVQTARKLAKKAGATSAEIEAVSAFAANGSLEQLKDFERSAVAALQLARVAAPAPSEIMPEDIEVATRELPPPEIVELLVWMSVLQLIHRLTVFYGTTE